MSKKIIIKEKTRIRLKPILNKSERNALKATIIIAAIVCLIGQIAGWW